jgi:thymidine kinase
MAQSLRTCGYRRLGMGVLRFSFGTMGSGKSTLALQIHHNLSRRGKRGMLLSQLDREGARVSSRLGISVEAVQVTPDVDLFATASRYSADHGGLDYLVCDEAQFYTDQQIEQLALVADVLHVDVYAFGLITDFRGRLFSGTQRLLELADERVQLQVEARCWCGERATHNGRLVNGTIVYEGEVVVVGDTDQPTSEPLFGDVVTYELLCRNHYRNGVVGR